jgi:hypothetical protein
MVNGILTNNCYLRFTGRAISAGAVKIVQRKEKESTKEKEKKYICLN